MLEVYQVDVEQIHELLKLLAVEIQRTVKSAVVEPAKFGILCEKNRERVVGACVCGCAGCADGASILANLSCEVGEGRNRRNRGEQGGEKVFAEEVEAILMAHPAVRDAAVIGRPSERFGEEVVAVVALESGTNATDAELIASCSKELARFKLPKAIFFRSEIQRGPTGKIDLPWLRQQVIEEDSA